MEYLPRWCGSASGETPEETKNDHTSKENWCKQRNSKRGIRSKEAIERRREKRTTKRRIVRRNKRFLLRGTKRDAKDRHSATAQEPLKKEKIKYGLGIWIATQNIHGVMRPGKREEVEGWMKKTQH